MKCRAKDDLWDHEYRFCIITEVPEDCELDYFRLHQLLIVETTNGATPREVGEGMAKPGKHNCRWELYDTIAEVMDRFHELGVYSTDVEHEEWERRNTLRRTEREKERQGFHL